MESQQKEHQAAIKIQALWRGYWIRNLGSFAKCEGCTQLDNLYNLYIFDGMNLCGPCFRDAWAEEEYRHSSCYCGDSHCPGGCGVLRCGCIDVCRCRACWDDY